ncbi:MAG: glycoside hydrolase family 73 protein [Tissierellia bacterium]|nr:glycoside hydrolase family 73 protein [Tissierellia bacterium]
MNKNKFIERVAKVAIEGYGEYGILPSLTIAQAILESDWGNKHIENNIFGIKAGSSWKGKVAIRKTKEWDGKKYITKEARFRAYDSFEYSIRDYLKLIGESKRYEKVKGAKDYKEASRLIYEAGYATDPKYSQKLIDIIEEYKLYDYDQKVKEQPISPWAKAAWDWAIKEGITDGKDPKAYATREQVVTMIYRLYKKKNN